MSTLFFAFTLASILNASESDGNISYYVVKDIEMNEVRMSEFKGNVLLIVNVASKCGHTRQYSGLQKIYEQYKDKGFRVLGFPCNDFGGQEPGSNEEIQQFCSTNFNVTFPMFDKVKVLGEDKSPLFAELTDNNITGKSDIEWNFEKFLIDKQGNIIKRFRNNTEPEDEELISLIEMELEK